MVARTTFGALVLGVALGAAARSASAAPDDGGPAPEAEAEIEVEGGAPAAAAPPASPAAPGDRVDPAGSDGPSDAPAAPVKDPKLARRWIAAAEQLVRRGDALARRGKAKEAEAEWGRAAVAYEKALEASVGDDLYLPLAQLEEKRGNAVVAVRHYRRLVAADAHARPATVKQATARLDAASAKVALVTLKVVPAGAEIALDGEPLGVAPLAEPLVLAPGRHRVSVSADGFKPRDLDLSPDAGTEAVRRIELEAVPVVAAPVAPPPEVPDEPPPPPPPPPPRPARWPLAAGAGLTVGLAATSVFTGLAAARRHDAFIAPESTSAERAAARTSGLRLAHATDACIVGAGLAAAATAYYYIAVYRHRETPPRAAAEARAARARPARRGLAKVEVAPWVQGTGRGGGDAGGLMVSGRF